MPELIEAYPMEDTYCDGLDHVEDPGNGNLKFFFYAEPVPGQRRLACRLVMPMSALPDGIFKSLSALALAKAALAKVFPAFERMMMH